MNQEFPRAQGDAGEGSRKTLQKNCDPAVGAPPRSPTFVVRAGILRDIPVHLRNLGERGMLKCDG